MEIVTSWMKQGIRQGRKEGRHEGELGLVLRQLNRRLGKVEVRLQSRIRKLPLSKLEALAEALLDFETTGDLERWVDVNVRENGKSGGSRGTRKTRPTARKRS